MVLAQGAERIDHLLEDSPSPTISPDLVVTSSPPISLAVRSTRFERCPGGAAAGDRVQPRHDLDVVVEDVGALVR